LEQSAGCLKHIGEYGARPAAQITDRDMLRQVARGDEGAFGELHRRHSRSLCNYLLRLVHEPGIAEDLLQEVYLAVWRGAGASAGGQR